MRGDISELEGSQVSAAEIRRASTIAGIALLVLALLSGFGYLAVIERLVAADSAAETAANLADSEGLFRLAIASILVVAVLDIVVAWALFTVFEPANRSISALAATFRVAAAAVSTAGIAQLVGVLRHLPDAQQRSAQVLAAVNAHQDMWDAALFLFGFHLVLLGVLVWRAVYAPTILGILLVIAGAGYLADALGLVLIPDYDISVAVFTFFGEVVLIFWLLLRGRRLTPPLSAPNAAREAS